MNEGHEAGSDAIKAKKNKKADFKTLNIHIRSFSEREREIEKPEGRTTGAGAEKQRVNGQRQISDDRSTAGVYCLQISDRAPEQRPISDLR